jgi:hypothetical protein
MSNNHSIWTGNPSSPLNCYSPLPTRFYARADKYGKHPRYAQAAMAFRPRQWFWNLIWLASPDADELLWITDQAEYEAFEARAKLRMKALYNCFHSLDVVRHTIDGKKRWFSEWAQWLPPQEFMELVNERPKYIKLVDKALGKGTVETMNQQAELSHRARIEDLTVAENDSMRMFYAAEYKGPMQRFDEKRHAWLNQAGEMLREHFEASGVPFPEIKVDHDRFTFKRYGACYTYRNTEHRKGDIVMTRLNFDTQQILRTLVHEIVHAAIHPYHHHDAFFYKTCVQVGLHGKKDQTADENLQSAFDEIVEEIGQIPNYQYKTKH